MAIVVVLVAIIIDLASVTCVTLRLTSANTCIVIIPKYNGVLLVKVKTWKTAFGKKNINLERPMYLHSSWHVRDDLFAGNQCLLGNENRYKHHRVRTRE